MPLPKNTRANDGDETTATTHCELSAAYDIAKKMEILRFDDNLLSSQFTFADNDVIHSIIIIILLEAECHVARTWGLVGRIYKKMTVKQKMSADFTQQQRMLGEEQVMCSILH